MTPEQKEKHKIRQRRWMVKNREKVNNYSLKYYHANKELVATKHTVYSKKSRSQIATQQRLKKRERKLEAIEYLGSRCWECQQQHHPAVYEFHHLDPISKDRDPSKMLSLSWIRLSAELDKCALLCANCHRLVHHKDKY